MATADNPQFEWDAANIGHVARHGVTQSEVEDAVLDPNAVMLEIDAGEEERVKAVGATAAGRIIVAVFTLRGEAIRPITAYEATIRINKVYLEGGTNE